MRLVHLLLGSAISLSGTLLSAQRSVQIGDRVVSLEGYGIAKGSDQAPVWIVELADFGCSYCEKFALQTMPAIDSAFTNRSRVNFRFIPMVTGMFSNSTEAAEAAICAAEQGRFWPMHDRIYARRRQWMASKAARPMFARFAQELGLRMPKYGACVTSRGTAETIVRNNNLSRSLFMRGTPYFVINGEAVPGALPTEIFLRGIDAVYKSVSGTKN